VTDLGGAHPTWFNPGVDKCFIPSDALFRAARERLVGEEQLVQYGLPIRRGFWADRGVGGGAVGVGGAGGSGNFFEDLFAGFAGDTKPKTSPKAKLQGQLGLQENLPTVLIVGGGDGMGGIIEQAKSMGEKLASKGDEDGNGYQMVVVCGNNQKAQSTLKANPWGDNVNVVVNGFVDNMDEWMRSSDVIVTKAGPGTIAEASICGLPCMLSSYLPGQEEGNVPFVEEAGFGTYSGDPKKIAETVSTWLSSPEMLKEMKEAALEAARPTATVDIAKDLAKMLFDYKKNQELVAKSSASASASVKAPELVAQ